MIKKLKTFAEFALPSYRAQNEPSEDDGEWITGDPPKGYVWNTSKDADANLEDMKKQIEKDRS